MFDVEFWSFCRLVWFNSSFPHRFNVQIGQTPLPLGWLLPYLASCLAERNGRPSSTIWGMGWFNRHGRLGQLARIAMNHLQHWLPKYLISDISGLWVRVVSCLINVPRSSKYLQKWGFIIYLLCWGFNQLVLVLGGSRYPFDEPG